MKNIFKFAAAVFAMVATATPAAAQLEAYEDYEISDAVWEVSTIKVEPNMGDYYLEGLRQSWVQSNAIQKKLGHIEDYAIYGSAAPESGEFNMLLVVKFAKTADMAPNKAKYDAFMKEWSDKEAEKSRETSKNVYPNIRKITGQYLMRELTMK